MMRETIEVKTTEGTVLCSYYASERIEGAERINKSVERMRHLLEATYPRAELGDIEYELYVYESEEVNAFSTKTEEGYVIAFSTAVFIKFYKVVKNMFFVEEIRKWFEVSPTQTEYCINAIYDYMNWFIAFHELFHIINGHCKWLSVMGIFHAEKLTKNERRDNLQIQIVESDADYCAIQACVNLIFIQIINEGAFDEKTDSVRRYDLIEAAKQEILFMEFAVYQIFLLFSQEEKAIGNTEDLLKYDHPYASIRMAYSFSVMIYQLSSFLPMDEVKELVYKIAGICIAYDRIYYAEEAFERSLVSLAFTERGVQHVMRLHNGWNHIVDQLNKYSYIKQKEKEEISELQYWVKEDGTMMWE